MDFMRECIERLQEEKRCIDIVIERLELLAQSRGLIILKRIVAEPKLQLGDGKR